LDDHWQSRQGAKFRRIVYVAAYTPDGGESAVVRSSYRPWPLRSITPQTLSLAAMEPVVETLGTVALAQAAHLAASLVLILTWLLLRLGRTWPNWLLLSLRLASFAVLTFFLHVILGSPIHPRFTSPSTGTSLWEHFIESGWWLLTAGAAIHLVRLLVVLEHRPRETQIVSDLLAGGISIATLLAIVNFVFGIPIAGLVATSGVIAIVLGLALQNTLSDVFSGIAVDLERPFKAGDLIWVEGDIEGHVAQLTWRSTHISTGPGNIAIVPNSVIAKARVINRSLPIPSRSDSVMVKLDPTVPPNHCMDVLSAAAQAATLPLLSPSPSVSCIDINPENILYAVSYKVESSELLPTARTELLTLIHRHLLYAGIGFIASASAPKPISDGSLTADEVLARSDLFGTLDASLRRQVSAQLESVCLASHDALILDGCVPHHLFLIVRGVVEIAKQQPSHRVVLQKLGPGESVGAMGAITGCVYPADAIARTPVQALRLSREALLEIVSAAPELGHILRDRVERNKSMTVQDSMSLDSAGGNSQEALSAKLRDLLHFLVR
jgi:small-conductance mechanosensitive channel/CRP-like cAMP-binding protein